MISCSARYGMRCSLLRLTPDVWELSSDSFVYYIHGIKRCSITCTCTAWFRQAAFLLIARDGSIAASASSFLSAYLAPGARFRNQFLRAFARYYRQEKLRLVGRLSGLNRPAAFDLLYKALKKKRWVVYAKRPFGGPEHVLKYLARYTHRIAIANGRLVSCEGGNVTFRWRDSRNGNAQKTLTIDAIEFIRRFLMHVLPVGFVKIRHFGFLANANRRTLLALCRSLIATVHTVPQILSGTEARIIDRICPVCKTGKLCVILRIDARVLMQLPNPVLVNTS